MSFFVLWAKTISIDSKKQKGQLRYFRNLFFHFFFLFFFFLVKWNKVSLKSSKRRLHFIQWTKLKIISIFAQRVETKKRTLLLCSKNEGKRGRIRGLNSHEINGNVMWEGMPLTLGPLFQKFFFSFFFFLASGREHFGTIKIRVSNVVKCHLKTKKMKQMKLFWNNINKKSS